MTKRSYYKETGRQYIHFVQSFSNHENISAETVKTIADELLLSDIKIEYGQAVKVSTMYDNKMENLKTYDSTLLACIYHKGSYHKLPKAYGHIMNWIDKNNYSIIDSPRECYIKGPFDSLYIV